MNQYYLDLETSLPNECIEDIKRLEVEDRNEKRLQELFDRYKYWYEKDLRLMTDKEFWKFAFNHDTYYETILTKQWERYKKIKTIKRLSEYREKEEMIENLLYDLEWSEPEFIDYIVDVYIDD